MEKLIKSHFPDSNRIPITDIIDFTNKYKLPIGVNLREVVENKWYVVEAYFPFLLDGVTHLTIVFNHDFLSPSKQYNRQELITIFQELIDQAYHIKKKLNVRSNL